MIKLTKKLQNDIVILNKIIEYVQPGGILTHQKGAHKGKPLMSLLKTKNKDKFISEYPEIYKDIKICYDRFKKEMDVLHKKYMYNDYANIEEDNEIQFIVVNAIRNLIFTKDKRTLEELIENVYNGWKNENKLMENVTKAGLHIKLDGGEKNREISFFSFNAAPDFLINGHLVEFQQGRHNFFKKNKLEKNSIHGGQILFKDLDLGYHLFTTQEIKILLVERGNAIRYGKPGRLFNKEEYEWFDNVGDALSELKEDF